MLGLQLLSGLGWTHKFVSYLWHCSWIWRQLLLRDRAPNEGWEYQDAVEHSDSERRNQINSNVLLICLKYCRSSICTELRRVVSGRFKSFKLKVLYGSFFCNIHACTIQSRLLSTCQRSGDCSKVERRFRTRWDELLFLYNPRFCPQPVKTQTSHSGGPTGRKRSFLVSWSHTNRDVAPPGEAF